ncbi:hypothetical protein [Marinovum sp.]|uniref:hypothetical protein n=1 Tax=Marinovum sp. TaxID=2024839 RepID=UPI003A8ECC92
MASIAFIFGSTFGAFGGLLGWLVFGMSGLAALSLYFGLALALPMLCIALSLITAPLRSSPSEDSAPARGPIAA